MAREKKVANAGMKRLLDLEDLAGSLEHKAKVVKLALESMELKIGEEMLGAAQELLDCGYDVC